MKLENVQGLGPATITKLKAAGIGDVATLAAVDLRTKVEVPGISRDALRGHKAKARAALAAEGKQVPKAPYAKGKQTKPARRSVAKEPAPVAKPRKKGFFARLRRRSMA